MNRLSSSASLFCIAAAALLTAVEPAHASLILNQAGIDLGFTLSTFVSGYSASYGPLAQGIAPNGHVVTGSLLNTRIYAFNDVDGQTLGSAVSSVPYTCQTGNCNFAMTTAGGQVYGAQLLGGIFYQFAENGSFAPIPNLQAAGLRDYAGMWANPVDGHLIASSNRGLVDIDPVTGSFRVINTGLFPDGVSVSPDGTAAYLAIGGGVQSYSIATGALLNSFSVGGGPDGTGVINGGPLNGRVVVNNNNGTVVLLDPSKPVGDPTRIIVIASGGTRGDFVSPDITNGTLFLSQNEQVARLSCGPGCSIGSVQGGEVPEPATFALFGSGLTAALLLRRRHLRPRGLDHSIQRFLLAEACDAAGRHA
jgi:hypothetical protein